MSTSIHLESQLLLAAFASKQQALLAWTRWQSESGWEKELDFDAYLLLPRVYHNLGGHGVDDALFKRLKGVVKRNWVANAATLSAIGRVAGLLEPRGIATVLLPPHSLLLLDRSTALVPGTPIRFQVARRDAQCVTGLMHEAGWRCVITGVPRWSLPGYIAATNSIALCDAAGTTLDLQWVDAVAVSCVVHELHGTPLRSPHTRSGIRWLLEAPGMGSELCRISRALSLLSKAPDDDAWRYLLWRLQQRGSPFFELAADLSPVCISSTVSAGNSMQDTVEPRETAAIATRTLTFRQRLTRPWRLYRGVLGDELSTLRALTYLPGYLIGKWDLQHVHELVPRAYGALRYHWRQRGRVDVRHSR